MFQSRVMPASNYILLEKAIGLLRGNSMSRNTSILRSSNFISLIFSAAFTPARALRTSGDALFSYKHCLIFSLTLIPISKQYCSSPKLPKLSFDYTSTSKRACPPLGVMLLL